MELKEMQGFSLLKDLVPCLFIIAAIYQPVCEQILCFRGYSEVQRVVQLSKLVSIESRYDNIHHVELLFLEGELLVSEFTIIKLLFYKFVKELEDHGEFLFIGFLTSKRIALISNNFGCCSICFIAIMAPSTTAPTATPSIASVTTITTTASVPSASASLGPIVPLMLHSVLSGEIVAEIHPFIIL